MAHAEETAESGPRRPGAIVPGAILLLLLLIAFRGALSGRMFYLRDISQNHYPVRHLVTERLRALSPPLWDPFHGGGTPLLANPDNLVLHPISLLFLPLPFDVAFTASIVLQFVLLAWGGYLLARALPVRREAATLAGVILALSGPAASLASQQNVLSAVAWVPLGLAALVRGIEPRRRWLLAPAAACVAVVLTTGEPASLLAFALVGAVLGATARHPRETGPGALPGVDGVRPFGARILWVLAPVLALGATLAAAQMLPARELLGLSVRGAGFSPAEGLKWSLEPARLLETFVPRLFGDPTRLSPQAWWGGWRFEGGYPFLLSIYIGAIPCLLALLGLSAPTEGGATTTRRRALGVVVAVGVWLALGRRALLGRLLFVWLPLGRQVRYPERFVLTAWLALALLAALGLDRLLNRQAPMGRIGAFLIAAAGAAFLAMTLVAASPSIADGFLAWSAALPSGLLQSETGAVLRGALLRSSLWLFGETAILALAALATARLSSGGGARIVGWGIVVVSGLSSLLAAAPALSTAAPGWLEAPSPLAALVGHGAGAPRLHHAPRPADLSIWATTDELVWGYRFDRFCYSLMTGHVDQVPTILDAATDRMDLRVQAEIGRTLEALPLAARVKVLEIARAGFLLSYEPLEHPDLEPIGGLEGFSRPPLRLYRVGALLPRAFLVCASGAPAHPEDWARSLADPAFDPRRTVLLEEVTVAAAWPGAGDREEACAGRATITQEQPERLQVEIEAERSGYLVLADAWAPGWRARIDGTPAPILKADGLYRAVVVAPGRHAVVMDYAPASLRAGLAASLAGFVIAAAWAAFHFWRRG
ncbi:MAG TPA: hypothetical protein VFT43_08370 [Candidatus Polarisedimenticolia bacterium]|nr:hypothetical protein [Candidatus Polarisedimenticolia bacterium]